MVIYGHLLSFIVIYGCVGAWSCKVIVCSCMVVSGHVKSCAGKIGKMGDLGNKVSLRKWRSIGKIDSKG